MYINNAFDLFFEMFLLISSCAGCVQAVEQTLLSRDSAVSFVIEKGETLLTLLHSPSITDNMTRLQTDYQEMCCSARVSAHSPQKCFTYSQSIIINVVYYEKTKIRENEEGAQICI